MSEVGTGLGSIARGERRFGDVDCGDNPPGNFKLFGLEPLLPLPGAGERSPGVFPSDVGWNCIVS